MSVYLGIDNGMSGAMAFWDNETGKLVMEIMPVIKVPSKKGFKSEYNIVAILDVLKQWQPDIKMAVLEKAQPYPGQGAVSNFTIGRSVGIMEGILSSLGIPYMLVHPKSWQKRMFEGVAHEKGQLKQTSILVAQRLFPLARFISGEKSIKLHDGMSDAALMAVYASKL